MACGKCSFRGWHINTKTRLQEPCPHCKPELETTTLNEETETTILNKEPVSSTETTTLEPETKSKRKTHKKKTDKEEAEGVEENESTVN